MFLHILSGDIRTACFPNVHRNHRELQCYGCLVAEGGFQGFHGAPLLFLVATENFLKV